MKNIKVIDLVPEDRRKILIALEMDGFSNIEDHEYFISFSKFPRDFELYSLNLDSINNDGGINILLKEKDIFSDKKNIEGDFLLDFSNLIKIKHKNTANGNSSDIGDQIINTPGWKIQDAYDLKDSSKFITEAESTELIHVIIKGKSHILLNNGENDEYVVYETHPDILLNLLTESLDNIFEAPHTRQIIREISID